MTNSWVNWAGDQRCAPTTIAAPRSLDELAGLLKKADETDATVRVVGAGHSFTDTVLTDGTLLSLENMSRIVSTDAATGLVRVEAGATLAAVSAGTHAVGLAFPNLGDIDVQSVAGAQATGTHGTGATLPNLSAAVHSVEVMRADGTTVEVNAENDPDAWRAARVSVGALGVITAVTLQMVPSFVLEAVERPVHIDEVLGDLDGYVDGNDHFEFFLFPHSPMAMTKRNNRVDLPEVPRSATMTYLEDILLANTAFDAMARAGRRYPALIPWVHRTAARAGSYRRVVDRSYRVFASPRTIRFTEMEYALPREHSVEAVREIARISRTFDTPMPMEVRWVAGDDAFLSPAGGRDTCYVAVHQYQGMEYEPYFRACEAVFDSFGGRPHWGKRHFQTAETLRPKYPEWDRFQEVRRRFDPAGRFANPYVDRVLGPLS
ncbi:D-arabinono-1,4-lactone oxidase [Nocardia stercoris]|uniref:FAD-binding protein n=1 Tax=Nocardia stercoris TaxID=2483361 RepID=A0A3M2LCM4_9NOCA|nr:D-arabinono-1,4-lactone oxidase [Nocardia stercoris]RMI35299.1 FAD-binding protein [Nocardia stercoris]